MKNLLVAVIVLAVSTAQAATIHVDIANCPGPGDGSEAEPYCSIQTAIDNAVDADEIVVAPGTYFEAINFLGKAITLRSSDGRDVTMIDGTGNLHVVQCVNGEGSDTVLDGFTITGGLANGSSSFEDIAGGGMLAGSSTVTNCTFSGNTADFGGGIYNGGSSTVTDCTFTGNTANFVGGGIYNTFSSTVINCTFIGNTAGDYGGGMQNSASSTVTNCTFTGNTAGSGGGMYIAFGSPTVTNCTFSGNSAGGGGGGMWIPGGSGPTVTNCTFSGNSAGGGGGGMHLSAHGGSPTVSHCTFSGNSAGGGGGMINSGGGSGSTVANCSFVENTASNGGGMLNICDSPKVTNCTFSGNTADFDGGGMCNIFISGPTVTNCTFSGNSAESGGGMANLSEDPVGTPHPTVTDCTFSGNTAINGHALSFDGGNPNYSSHLAMTNCILWDGGDEIWNNDGSTIAINYTDFQGGFPGIGNIDADPLFVDPDNGDYRLSAGSPCIDAGNNWGVHQDTTDLDGDGDTRELTPWDLDGNPRFNADPADFDPGCGVPVVVDIGAYEFQFDPVDEVFLGDLNGDGIVGIVDFLALLANWGPCEPGCCLADLDIDGDVGIADFLLLLGNWG